MKWDIDGLEKRLNTISNQLDSEEERINKINKKIETQDLQEDFEDLEVNETTRPYYGLHYELMNKKYKQWISQYSKEYIEMSDWYYGEELPYDIYCRDFKIFDGKSTYLDSPKDINELYSLFIFFSMFHYNLSKTFANQ
tara:strand:- start:83 stop:499 length:417 start_codon:yes stop_codon:yes gene_type:complete